MALDDSVFTHLQRDFTLLGIAIDLGNYAQASNRFQAICGYLGNSGITFEDLSQPAGTGRDGFYWLADQFDGALHPLIELTFAHYEPRVAAETALRAQGMSDRIIGTPYAESQEAEIRALHSLRLADVLMDGGAAYSGVFEERAEQHAWSAPDTSLGGRIRAARDSLTSGVLDALSRYEPRGACRIAQRLLGVESTATYLPSDA